MAQGTNVGQIFLQLSVQNNVASQITTQSRQATTQATSIFSSGAAGIASMASKFIAGAAVASLVAFGKEAISVASDLQEVQNVVDTAFGDMAGQCEEFAATASQQFGISELQAKKMASTFMSMSTGMGLSGDEAAKMSINVAKLSADVASFYNLSADEASTKLKAVWTGETEGLKDLGVVMTQTNLEAYAMSNGITKNIADMTQAEQTVLRYNYVMDQLSLAQGDFAKTSDSWSNSMKAMGENLKTAMGNIGEILIQVFTPALQVLSELVSKFAELTEWAASAVSSFLGTESTEEAVKNITDSGSKMADAIEEENNEISEAAGGLAGFDKIYTIDTEDSSETTDNSVMDAFGDIEEYKSAETEKEGVLDKFGDKIKDVYNEIKPYLEGFYNVFISPFVDAFEFCISYLKTKIGPLKEIFGNIFDSAKSMGSSFVETYSGIFSDLWTSLQGYWEKYGKGIFQGMVDGLVGAFSTIQNLIGTVIQPLFENFFSIVGKTWDEHLKPMFDSLLTMLGEVGTFILKLLNKFIIPFVNYIIDTSGPAIVGAITWVWEAVSNVSGFIMDVFNVAFQFIASIANGLSELLDKGIIGVLQDFVNNVGELFSGLWEIIKTPINWIIEGVNKAIGALNTISITVPDWVPLIGGQNWGFNIPEIPMLADGGIVDQPTLNIAGEAGAEAITPIDKLEEIIARVVSQTMAAMKETQSEQVQEIRIPLTVNLGNKTVMREVISSINRQSKVNGKSVIINT